jgi:hypothetical protein
MKKLLWLGAIGALLLAPGSIAFAQPAGDCPDDVAAAIGAACPCGGDSGGHTWKNHGKYVSCVVRFRNDLRRAGCLDAAAKRTIARCAARSTCGKDGAVLCCVYDTSGTCDGDTVPGDGTADGACSNDATHACDTDTDCITASGPKVKRHEETCTDHGGTVVGTGSACSACPIPPPAPGPQ